MKRRFFLSSAMMGIGGVLMDKSVKGRNFEKSGSSNMPGEMDITEFAPNPPLGFNSFDSYGVYLHHEAAMANIKAMAEKLKPHGYEYFVIDAGWFGEFELIEGTIYPKEKHAAKVNINEFGIYQPSKTYFPHGLTPIVSYAHELGLKIGIHLMRGISRKAVELNLPVKNSKYRAQDVADTSSVCSWNKQNYGIDASKPGAQDWYDSVYSQVAEWGFDFVKVDDLTPYPKEIVLIANAIEKTGRKMVYSLSPGGGIYMPDLPYYRRANMVRTTKDIWDRRADLDKAFLSWKKFQSLACKGFWPDLDMIPFGQLQLMSPKKYDDGSMNAALAGKGFTRWCRLSPQQMRTFITMRSLAASPLFVGGDLPTLDDYSLNLLTNPEMLACNQNGQCGMNVYEKDGIEVWLTPEKDKPGCGWLGIFNRNESKKTISLSRENLGLMNFIVRYELVPNTNAFQMLDVWNNKTFEFKDDNLNVSLDADDISFLRFKEI